MNIIFGDSADTLPDYYIKLKLDTFCAADGGPKVTAYCLIEKLEPDEFATVESYKKIHADLIDAYGNQHWHYCQQAIAGLMGKWNGELDTFYTNLLNRVNQHKENGVPCDWTAVMLKEPAPSAN